MDAGEAMFGLVNAFLLWQQNRILARQGPPMPPSNWRGGWQRAERYWPLVEMAFLTVLAWITKYYRCVDDVALPLTVTIAANTPASDYPL
jgi:hypothetical protein